MIALFSLILIFDVKFKHCEYWSNHFHESKFKKQILARVNFYEYSTYDREAYFLHFWISARWTSFSWEEKLVNITFFRDRENIYHVYHYILRFPIKKKLLIDVLFPRSCGLFLYSEDIFNSKLKIISSWPTWLTDLTCLFLT